MMDYEGIVRAAARASGPRIRTPGAMSVASAAEPGRTRPQPPQQQQQQRGQPVSSPRRELSAAAPYPVPMAMR